MISALFIFIALIGFLLFRKLTFLHSQLSADLQKEAQKVCLLLSSRMEEHHVETMQVLHTLKRKEPR